MTRHQVDAALIIEESRRSEVLWPPARPVPVTADDVASAQRIHRNVARARLERLADGGWRFARSSGGREPPARGAGRPPKTYRVAPELSAIEFPERR